MAVPSDAEALVEALLVAVARADAVLGNWAAAGLPFPHGTYLVEAATIAVSPTCSALLAAGASLPTFSHPRARVHAWQRVRPASTGRGAALLRPRRGAPVGLVRGPRRCPPHSLCTANKCT